MGCYVYGWLRANLSKKVRFSKYFQIFERNATCVRIKKKRSRISNFLGQAAYVEEEWSDKYGTCSQPTQQYSPQAFETLASSDTADFLVGHTRPYSLHDPDTSAAQ
jgi:hypothetical protein